jgi:formylglycine-generating enzyme
MHGNVGEWCQDQFADYPTEDQQDPVGGMNGDWRMLRGGSWHDFPRVCRSARRDFADPHDRIDDCGCRVVLCLD